MFYRQWVALLTILGVEMRRMIRIWPQTLLPPIVTTTLYFIIFGHIIGSKIGAMEGYPYIEYIAPGLIMMALINNSYVGSVSAFFGAKFQRHIEEVLIAPVYEAIIVLGYMLGGMCRGFVIGIIVTLVTLFFTHIRIHLWWIILLSSVLTTAIFSLGGIINGIYAKKFDDIAIIPTFILTPFVYLGGVFYSISLLPASWRYASMLNPIVYIIDNFRYGFLGITDHYLKISYIIMLIFFVGLFILAWQLIRRGVGMRD